MDKKENAEKMMKEFFRLKDADMYRFWLNVCLCYGVKIDEKCQFFALLFLYINSNALTRIAPREREKEIRLAV